MALNSRATTTVTSSLISLPTVTRVVVSAEPSPSSGLICTRSSPSKRSSCDTLVTTCYDESGASADLTGRYFGARAADKLAKRPRTIQRYGDFITCDRVSDVCYDRLGAGVGITRLYIGEAQSEALLKRLRAKL